MRTRTAVALLCTACASHAQLPLFHWPLDESSGNIAHCWGGDPGFLAGSTTWAPTSGHHQGAARFDGVDDRIILGPCDITTGNNAITISFWAKPDFVTGMERTLVAKATGPQLSDHVWSVSFVSGTALRFRLKAGGVSSELSTPPSSIFGGTWHHIAALHDGAQMRLYLNGSLMGTAPKTGLIGLHPQAPASIGALSTGTQAFSGWIDDVRIYDRALSEPELLGLLFENMTTEMSEPSSIEMIDQQHFETITVHDAMGRVLYTDNGSSGAWQRIRERCNGFVIVRATAGDQRLAWPAVIN
ncbi:MAG: LamG domain-containing protein [Flavobacteriales bacterium]|nr:LamG domain-containing protein [Flavobacteriales bacterium]